MKSNSKSQNNASFNEASFIPTRLMEIRQFRKFKQSFIGDQMGITQQAYSILENRRGTIGVSTLLRFCKATNVSLELLMSKDLPITEENIQFFNERNTAWLLEEYKMMQQQLKFYESMLSVKMAS